jgi:gamma-glutamyltranspeptidase/glutathione hydrolase
MRQRTLILIVVIVLVACGGAGLTAAPTTAAARVDLSPGVWPAGDLEEFAALEDGFGTLKAAARGDEGMVVGTTGPLAVRSGVEALRQGGNAIDAAITTSLAQIVLVSGATVSFAGRMALVTYDASTGEISYLNGSWDVPSAEDGLGIAACGVDDGRQVLVHGYMAGIEAAHDRFGRLPFKALFRPAIYFARRGFAYSRIMNAWVSAYYDRVTATPEGRALFLKPDGSRYAVGETFRQTALARTLTKVSRQGARYLYRKKWAKKFLRRVRAAGGRVTAADLKRYEPTWLEPLAFEYDDHTVHGPREPGLGGIHLQGALGSIDLRRLRGGHYTESAEALEQMLQAVESREAALRVAGSHSDGVVAVDAEGNVAALLHTINADPWGAGLFVDGISIADVGCWASARVAEVGPGARMPMPDNPLIITRDGAPVAASSAIGAGLYPSTLFSIVNLMSYGMGAEQAIDTPTFDQATFGDDGVTHRVTAGEFTPSLLAAVRDRGFTVVEHAASNPYEGYWVAITIDPRTGALEGDAGDGLNGIAVAR